MGCFFGEGVGEIGNPGSEVVGFELSGVASGESGLDEEEDGEVIGGEGLEGLGKSQEAIIDHELNPAGDFRGVVFEPSRRPDGHGGIQNEEPAVLHGGLFEILGRPLLIEKVGAGGFELSEHRFGAGLLEGGKDFRGDLAGQEAGCKLKDGGFGGHDGFSG